VRERERERERGGEVCDCSAPLLSPTEQRSDPLVRLLSEVVASSRRNGGTEKKIYKEFRVPETKWLIRKKFYIEFRVPETKWRDRKKFYIEFRVPETKWLIKKNSI
jgi:hypothetical protein